MARISSSEFISTCIANLFIQIFDLGQAGGSGSKILLPYSARFLTYLNDIILSKSITTKSFLRYKQGQGRNNGTSLTR